VKITFEGQFNDILDQMRTMLIFTTQQAGKASMGEAAKAPAPVDTPKAAKAQGPGPEAPAPEQKAPVEIPVEIPVATFRDKPAKKPRTAKQLENDERLRAAALAKVAAKKASPKKEAPPVEEPAEEEPEDPTLDPAEVVKLRQKTIEDLQAAYAGGHQKEVFELLARFGNGAKSFRELPADAFVPIRKAIDNGALA